MSYLTYDEIAGGLQLLCDEYPQWTQLLRLPNLSVEARPIYAVAIGEHRGTDVRSAIFVGGIHAREWVPPDSLFYLCADLLEARKGSTGLRYGQVHFNKEQVAGIFEKVQLVLLPCANPDGRVYSQVVDPDWRKNRARTVASNGAMCFGVGLNRNFDIAWNFKKYFAPGNVSASDNPRHKYLYVGPAPESEPETRNVAWLLTHFRGAQWFIDVHSAIPAIFHSWGLDENQSDDESRSFLNSADDGNVGSPETTRTASSSKPRISRRSHVCPKSCGTRHGWSTTTRTMCRQCSHSMRRRAPATTTRSAAIASIHNGRRYLVSRSSAVTNSNPTGPRRNS